jgi:cytochrome c
MKAIGQSVLFAAAVLMLAGTARPQVEIVPGSAFRGKDIFSAKGCINCHSIDGVGGTSAPDLARRSARIYSPDLLASVMWNHGPEMWARIEASGRNVPTFTAQEAADLFSYFYSTLYFSVPGDAARGRTVFIDKNCAGCHAIDGTERGETVGPPVSSWARVRDPILWSERMWNHSEQMYAQMQSAGIDWPTLSTQQMVDLLIYLRNLPDTGSEQANFQPGEPELGRAIFTSNCERCHSFGQSLPGRVDLLNGAGPKTLTGYAAEMWNHAPLMRQRAGAEGLPQLEDGAMSDLVGYLFAQRYFSERGDIAAGARVYEAKGCIVCHEQQQAQTGAPDLKQGSERYSPITLTRALWTHGPQMLRALDQRGLGWPVFEGHEMTDLIAYLNSRLVPRIAESPGR